MKDFLSKLRSNSFFFLCMISGAVLVFILQDSGRMLGYISGILITWVLVSVIGVDLSANKASAKNSAAEDG